MKPRASSEVGLNHRLVELTELQKTRIFLNAASGTLTRLQMSCKRENFESGQTIVSRGDLDSRVMLLLKGQVRVTMYSPQGREIGIRRIQAGEVFGDYGAIDCAPRSADVVAVSDVEVAAVSARDFRQMVTSDPAVALAQMQELVSMVRHLSDRVYLMTTHKASERLIACLISLAGDKHEIEDIPTHAELASLISSQRHVVTTEMSRLEEQGLIQRLGNRGLRIMRPDALRALQRHE